MIIIGTAPNLSLDINWIVLNHFKASLHYHSIQEITKKSNKIYNLKSFKIKELLIK